MISYFDMYKWDFLRHDACCRMKELWQLTLRLCALRKTGTSARASVVTTIHPGFTNSMLLSFINTTFYYKASLCGCCCRGLRCSGRVRSCLNIIHNWIWYFKKNMKSLREFLYDPVISIVCLFFFKSRTRKSF